MKLELNPIESRNSMRISTFQEINRENLIQFFVFLLLSFLWLIFSFQYELQPNGDSDLQQDDLSELHRRRQRQWYLRVRQRQKWFRRIVDHRRAVDHSWTKLLFLRRQRRRAVQARLGLRNRRPARRRLAAEPQPAASAAVPGASRSRRQSVSSGFDSAVSHWRRVREPR